MLNSFRRAILHPDGIEHLHPPEYHGNPVDPEGVLVTFHYGYDLPELIHRWAGLNTMVCRFHDHHIGVIGEFTEVYVYEGARRCVLVPVRGRGDDGRGRLHRRS